ncbi:hypothetical protein Dsin_028550 [Dipteronia sinensis]|uniref:Uncharacterized protein n=1 Tax=Dipteronia sinensis TaxID=43782 RepID=A0AAD9ZR24_9ROSI|nr:hypothetical protein Dsin_028550 [Dipteronia sinensis]
MSTKLLICIMYIVKPRECNVISLINDAKKELKGHHIERWENWQLSITFPWNGLRHVLTTHEKLMFCFEEFDRCEKLIIKFELILVLDDIEFPKDEPFGMFPWSDENNVEPVPHEDVEYLDDELIPAENVEYLDDEPVRETTNDESELDNEYKVDEESDDELDVNWSMKLTNKILVTMAVVILAVYNDLQECKNDACDRRPYASWFTDDVTFMINSVWGSHSMCQRVVENKEVTSQSVASILRSTIHANPIIKAKILKNQLQDKYQTVMAVGFFADGVPNPALVAEDDPVGHGTEQARAELESSAIKCDPDVSDTHLHDKLMGRDRELEEEDGSCRETIVLDVEPEVDALLPEDSANDH